MRIIVSGVLSLVPFSPGIAWDWMQVAVGLRRLGHDVWYVEEVSGDQLVDARGHACSYEASVQRRRFLELMRCFDLADRSCQLLDRGKATAGLSLAELEQVARESDLLINMSGHCEADCVLEQVGRRAYVDQDPVYTQLWRSEYGEPLDFDRHDVFFTVGLDIGTSRSPIPDGGVRWHHLVPPVVPDFWPVPPVTTPERFTTLASWAGYSDLEFRGERYGSKYIEFERFAELPRRLSEAEFHVSLREFRDDDPGIERLRRGGWEVSRSGRWASMDGYQEFIGASGAEIGIAQNAYVKGRSGWFSDRASHYLAMGRPVLAQSTGFERHLPTGSGLLAFGSLEEAVEGARRILQDYSRHRQAARDFVREHLDYRRVLPPMLDICAAETREGSA